MTHAYTAFVPRIRDDDLMHLAVHGVPALPKPVTSGYASNENARIWHARFVLLPDVSHFAPLQRPEAFNGVMLEFLGQVCQDMRKCPATPPDRPPA